MVGLMIGVLGTVLVQSSSTFTSIIVAGMKSKKHVFLLIYFYLKTLIQCVNNWINLMQSNPIFQMIKTIKENLIQN